MTIASLATMLGNLRVDFVDEIADPEGLPVAFENVPPPTENEAGFFQFTVVLGEEQVIEFGGPTNTWRLPGVVTVNVFTPMKSGTMESTRLAELIADHYRGKSIAGATFSGPSTTSVGPRQKWWQTNISVTFYADRFV